VSVDPCPLRGEVRSPTPTINFGKFTRKEPVHPRLKRPTVRFSSVRLQYGTQVVRSSASGGAKEQLGPIRAPDLETCSNPLRLPASHTPTHMGRKLNCILHPTFWKVTHAAGFASSQKRPLTRTCGHHTHLIFQPPKRGCWGRKSGPRGRNMMVYVCVVYRFVKSTSSTCKSGRKWGI